MATVLVTGGAGFIGSHVVDELLTMGHHLIVLDDLSGGCRENVNDRAVLVEGSILDRPNYSEVYRLSPYIRTVLGEARIFAW